MDIKDFFTPELETMNGEFEELREKFEMMSDSEKERQNIHDRTLKMCFTFVNLLHTEIKKSKHKEEKHLFFQFFSEY